MAKVDYAREKQFLDSKALAAACNDVLKDSTSDHAKHFLSKSKASGNPLLLTVQRPAGVHLMDLERYAPMVNAPMERLREIGENAHSGVNGGMVDWVYTLLDHTVVDLDEMQWQEVSVDSVRITVL